MLDPEYTFGTITAYCDTRDCNHSEQFEGFDNYPDFKQAKKEM